MMIYVKPAPGGRVRMPERGSRPMPSEGAWVPRNDYYERLLTAGDVAACEPPAAKAPAKKLRTPQPAAGLARPAKET